MSNFFLASGIIFAVSLIIVVYYWLKQLFKQKHENKLRSLIRKKYYVNEKEYLKDYLSHQLPHLTNNNIQWIIIWSKFACDCKAELTYNQISSKVIIKTNKIENLESFKYELLELGLKEFEIKYENTIFKTTSNAKIITDVLYFIFESLYNLKHFSNHKIMVSSV